MSIVHKCCDWNAARYNQEFNHDLAVNLLLEETSELFEATDNIEKLDAVGDIVFVAIGVLWKLGMTKEEIHNLFYDVPLNETAKYDTYVYMQHVQGMVVEKLNGALEFNALVLACHLVFVVAIDALRAMKLQHRFYDIVDAICESNNTKEVKGKVDASIKANVVKGAGYVPPTAALTEIYNSIN